MRLLEILFYLLRSNSKVTSTELARVYNVSTRTIQRDLDKLSVVGIPIIIYRGKNGGVEIDRNYVINRQVIRNTDYEKLLFAIYICENIREQFIVDLYDEKIDTESDVCKEIDKALESKNYIELDISKGKITIFPISYILRKEGLCLYGYNEGYTLLLIKDIYNVVVINKKYKGKVIDYRKNKNNIKII